MSDVIKTYHLKQHSPLIHFQYDQDGAALRATELKPKIDAWIIKQVTVGVDAKAMPESAVKYLKEHHPDWLVGGGRAQHPALDYKLRIQATPGTSYLVASNIAKPIQEDFNRRSPKVDFLAGVPYFADNEAIKKGQLDRARRGMMYTSISLEVFCLNEDLMKAIDDALPYVFAYNNFGVRQSKGFGCFSLVAQSETDFEDLLLEHPLYEKSFVLRWDKSNKASLKQLFDVIEKEYKILKSGFAHDPSQMKLYFEKKGTEWEKPALKKELVKNRGPVAKSDYTSDDKRKYIRALLGLAELYEFPQEREKLTIADSNPKDKDAIDRFRSPITFKIFGNNVYLLPEEIPDAIYDHEFTFTSSRKQQVKMKTPPKGSFDLNDFLYNHLDNTWENVGE